MSATVTVSAQALSQALKSVKGVITSKSTIPVIQCALIRASNGVMSVCGTDLVRSVAVNVPCDGDGEWLLNFDKLNAFSSASEKSKDVTISGDAQASLKCGKLTARIATLPVGDFPVMIDPPKFDGDAHFRDGRFVSSLSRAAMTCERSGTTLGKAVSISIDGTNGILSSAEKAVVSRIDFESARPVTINTVISIDECELISSVFGRDAIWVSSKDRSLWIKSEKATIHTQSLDCTVFDTSKISPTSSSFLTFDVAALTNATTSLSQIASQASRAVRLYRKNGQCFVGAAVSEASMSVPFDSDAAHDIDMTVNADRLLSILRAVPFETAQLGVADFTGPLKTAHIQITCPSSFFVLAGMRSTQSEIDLIVNGNNFGGDA